MCKLFSVERIQYNHVIQIEQGLELLQEPASEFWLASVELVDDEEQLACPFFEYEIYGFGHCVS